MATTSLYSSTTHSTLWSRRGSRQMRHSSSSETLKQVAQNLTRCFTSRSTSASRRTSAGSAWSRWNAIRWAPLGPTPGRRPSSSMRSWTMPSYKRGDLPAQTGQATAAETGHAATGERAESAAGQGVGLGLGVAVGGHDQVTEVAQVVVARAVEAARLDGDGLELADAVEGDRDSPAADHPLDPRLAQALLGALELLLHLLRLGQETLQVEATGLTAGPAERVEGVLGHGFTCRLSLVGDLFDDLGTQRLLEELGTVESRGLGIGVVGAR